MRPGSGESTFRSRRMLPAAWHGLRADELDRASGVPGGIFVHRTGFIGGHETRDGAIRMALAALALD